MKCENEILSKKAMEKFLVLADTVISFIRSNEIRKNECAHKFDSLLYDSDHQIKLWTELVDMEGYKNIEVFHVHGMCGYCGKKMTHIHSGSLSVSKLENFVLGWDRPNEETRFSGKTSKCEVDLSLVGIVDKSEK